MEAPAYSFLGNQLDSPLINAEGSINGTVKDEIVNRVKILSKTGIGAITLGSVTILPQAGNAARYGDPTYYHDPETGLTYNAMGLPNIGFDQAAVLITQLSEIAHDHGKPLFLSVSPSAESVEFGGDTIRQSELLVSRGIYLSEIDGLIYNGSCGNIFLETGERKSILGYDLKRMEDLVDKLTPIVRGYGKLGFKFPPYLSAEQLEIVPKLADLFNSSDVFSFVITSNTIPGHVALDKSGNPIMKVPGGIGSMSGPGAAKVGKQQLEMWRSLLKPEIEIGAELGIYDGRELGHRVHRLGASFGGGVSFLWQSENWGAAVTKMLGELAEYEDQLEVEEN